MSHEGELSPTFTEPASPGFTSDVERFLRMLRRGWRLLAITVGVCVAVAVIYLLVATPLYMARAQLLIAHHQGHPLNVANPDPAQPLTEGDDYIPTQAAIVGSHIVVERAIDSVGLDNLPTLLPVRQNRDPAEWAIEKYLKVSRPNRMANVLQIEYTAGSPGEAVLMVEAITASYQKFLKENYPRNSEVVALNTKARQDLARELEEAEKQYLEFRQKAPLVIPDEKGRTFVNTRLERWDQALNDAQMREVQLRAQYKLAQKLSKEGAGMWAILHAMNQLGVRTKDDLQAGAGAQAQVTSMDFVRQLTQEQQELAERFGPNYSKVQELQEEITRVQERVRESRGRYEQLEVGDLLKALEQSLTANEEIRAELNKQVEEGKKTETDCLVESNLRNNLERRRAMFNTVVDQLKQAQLMGGFSPVAAESLQPATALPSPVHPRSLLTLGVAVLLGLMVGSGLVVVRDYWQVPLRSAEDVHAALGQAVLGQLPQERPAREGTAALAGHTLPRSGLAAAFQTVRTNLALLRRQRDLRLLLVTSPGVQEGKTVAASNLAISLANAGEKVLLVDADLLHPSLHQLYGLPGNSGLTQILQGLSAAADVVQQSAIANLALVPAGPVVANPGELLRSPRLTEFLLQARSDYDTVVLDSSPLLRVTDPTLLAALVDGTTLVVRQGLTKRRDGERAVKLLRSLGTPLLGVLLNGTEPPPPSHNANGTRCGPDAIPGPTDVALAATALPLPNGCPANPSSRQ